jgi:hypothetical protein
MLVTMSSKNPLVPFARIEDGDPLDGDPAHLLGLCHHAATGSRARSVIPKKKLASSKAVLLDQGRDWGYSRARSCTEGSPKTWRSEVMIAGDVRRHRKDAHGGVMLI